jgi:hypothetical protein
LKNLIPVFLAGFSKSFKFKKMKREAKSKDAKIGKKRLEFEKGFKKPVARKKFFYLVKITSF